MRYLLFLLFFLRAFMTPLLPVPLALFASGCAATTTHIAEDAIFIEPNVVRVCTRPPNIPKRLQSWAYSVGGTPLLEEWQIQIAKQNGLGVYVFDPDAPPESVKILPIPYNLLQCPARPKPPPVVAKAPKKPEAKKVAAKKTEPTKPAPKPAAQKKCLSFAEPGQTRKRHGTGSKSCTRILLAPTGEREEWTAAPKTPKKIEAPEPDRLSDATRRQYSDWGLEPPDVSGLAQERARECLNNLCHSRHPNFIPKGKKPEGQRDGQSHSSGGDASSPKSSGKGTTVRTRKSPFSKPREPRLKKDGTPRQKTGPKTEDTAPHNKKVIEEREKLKAEGNKIVKGGRVPELTEEVIKTPGGHKTRRRPDITYETPDGQKRSRNVGKTNADGTPTPREQEALEDLNGPGKRPTDYAPYDR